MLPLFQRALSSSGSDDDPSSEGSDVESDASTGEKQVPSDGDGREQNGKTSNITDSDKSGEDGKKVNNLKRKIFFSYYE